MTGAEGYKYGISNPSRFQNACGASSSSESKDHSDASEDNGTSVSSAEIEPDSESRACPDNGRHRTDREGSAVHPRRRKDRRPSSVLPRRRLSLLRRISTSWPVCMQKRLAAGFCFRTTGSHRHIPSPPLWMIASLRIDGSLREAKEPGSPCAVTAQAVHYPWRYASGRSTRGFRCRVPNC